MNLRKLIKILQMLEIEHGGDKQVMVEVSNNQGVEKLSGVEFFEDLIYIYGEEH